jgi:hypothetical protein
MRGIHAALLAVPLLAAGETPAQLPTATKPAIVCIYGILRSKPAVSWVEVYAINEQRSMIAYAFDAAGTSIRATLTIHNMSWAPVYSSEVDYSEGGEPNADEITFTTTLFEQIESSCNVVPPPEAYPDTAPKLPRRRIEMPDG